MVFIQLEIPGQKQFGPLKKNKRGTAVIAQLFMFCAGLGLVVLWARHIYLVHFKFNDYMMSNYKIEWEKMKNDTGWYTPSWATLCYRHPVIVEKRGVL